MPKLKNAKHERFARCYAIHGNATRAAKESEYSQKTAYSIGHELLNKPEIRARVQEFRDRAAEELGITHHRVLEGLLKEAELFDEGASHSARVSAWEKLGKHLGILSERVDHTSGGQPIKAFIGFNPDDV